jgi:hypothetical protein
MFAGAFAMVVDGRSVPGAFQSSANGRGRFVSFGGAGGVPPALVAAVVAGIGRFERSTRFRASLATTSVAGPIAASGADVASGSGVLYDDADYDFRIIIGSIADEPCMRRLSCSMIGRTCLSGCIDIHVF